MASKAIAIYVLVLVVLIGVVLYLKYEAPSKGPSTVTSIQQTSISNTSTASTTTSNQSSTTSIPYNGACISQNKTVNIYNGNFNTGTWAGWNTSQYGFGPAPFNLIYANQNGEYYNGTWNNYNGNFFATTFHGGTAVEPGNITSNSFEVLEPYINFKIISPQNAALYITITSSNGHFITTYFNTYAAPGNRNPTSTFMNASVPVSIMLCQQAKIKVVADVIANLVNRQQYIAVGDFYQSKVQNATPGIVVNQTSG